MYFDRHAWSLLYSFGVSSRYFTYVWFTRIRVLLHLGFFISAGSPWIKQSMSSPIEQQAFKSKWRLPEQKKEDYPSSQLAGSTELVNMEIWVWRSKLSIILLSKPAQDYGNCSLVGGKVGQEDVQTPLYLGKGVPPELFSDVFWTESVLKGKVELVIGEGRTVPGKVTPTEEGHVVPAVGWSWSCCQSCHSFHFCQSCQSCHSC